MVDPLYALFVAGVVLLVSGFLFWPHSGYFWHWKRFRGGAERIMIEDALKHAYNYEYRMQLVTLESLSGALEIPRNQAADLLVRTEALGLIKSEGRNIRLSKDGRKYALQMLRLHRLWEHHLAEETGVTEAEWHREAECREHELSDTEANLLSEKMGHPVFDPHGDPIPTPHGEIAPRRGQPLSDHLVGTIATVVHIEDEPEAVYAQLVAEGLHLGMRIEVTDVRPERIHFWADGNEHVLAPVLAANISVAVFPVATETKGTYQPLTMLNVGEVGCVVRISKGCRGLERRRLMDLGVVPGTLVEVEMVSPVGDPTAYRIRGSTIALRKEQANHIHVSDRREKG